VPDTFIKIASVTVGSGGASSIDFTSIPSTYTDLLLKISGRNTANSSILDLTFNGSTSGYSYRGVYGVGSGSPASNNGSSVTSIALLALEVSTYTASTFSSQDIYIHNYTGSQNKSVSVDETTENNAVLSVASLYAGLWANSAAITSIKLDPDSGNFAEYSTATLYGIKNS
jgi:hypothetical protein